MRISTIHNPLSGFVFEFSFFYFNFEILDMLIYSYILLLLLLVEQGISLSVAKSKVGLRSETKISSFISTESSPVESKSQLKRSLDKEFFNVAWPAFVSLAAGNSNLMIFIHSKIKNIYSCSRSISFVS